MDTSRFGEGAPGSRDTAAQIVIRHLEVSMGDDSVFRTRPSILIEKNDGTASGRAA